MAQSNRLQYNTHPITKGHTSNKQKLKDSKSTYTHKKKTLVTQNLFRLKHLEPISSNSLSPSIGSKARIERRFYSTNSFTFVVFQMNTRSC